MMMPNVIEIQRLPFVVVFQSTVIKPFTMEISTYVGLGVSLLFLGTVFSLFWSISCIGGLNTNANTIRINLVMSLFVANAALLAGIDRGQLEVSLGF